MKNQANPGTESSELDRLKWQLTITQTALEDLRAKFEVVFNETLDIIIIISGTDGTILEVNRAIERMLGYRREQLLGQHFSQLFPPIDENISAADLLSQLQVHDVAFEGLELLRADGSTCPMDLTFNMIPWERETDVLVTLRDVTGRKQAEQIQQKLIQELDAFAHTVAHDLKAPLGVIVGATQVLKDWKLVKESHREQLTELIARSSKKMSNIIEELLLLAQMRDQDVEVYPLDMAEILNETRQRLDHMLVQYQAELILPETWPTAFGYGPWVEEVWVNYLSNALKYGGQPPYIQLGAEVQPDGMVKFWVRDNGPGIRPEEQGKLFSQFSHSAQVRAQGHGLGLSIVRRIVEKLGGEVGVESELGIGSVFSFTLPQKV